MTAPEREPVTPSKGEIRDALISAKAYRDQRVNCSGSRSTVEILEAAYLNEKAGRELLEEAASKVYRLAKGGFGGFVWSDALESLGAALNIYDSQRRDGGS